jgi:hypothetical protein
MVATFRPTGEINHLNLPPWLLNFHQNLLAHFAHPQNANFLFSVLTGESTGLSGRLIHDLDNLNLRFLLSPSGLHLAGFLFFIRKGKKRIPIYLACWMLPNFYALKRITLLKFLSLFTKKIQMINLFYITFVVSFLCGHFFKSPLGFTYSFLIIGTFFSLGELSLTKAFLALSASHILIAIFQGNSFSFIGLLFSLLIVQLFTLLLPILLIFALSFYLYPSHWIEPVVRIFILVIHFASEYSRGTFLTSTVFLLISLWIILLDKNKWWILICLLFHAEVLHTPTIYRQGSSTQGRLAFVNR